MQVQNETILVRNSRHASSRHAGGRRFRGLTCANCRARKVKCEGSTPVCKTCEAYHDECRYDKPPPMSQVLAMAKRLQEAEDRLEQLRRGGSLVPSGPSNLVTPVIASDFQATIPSLSRSGSMQNHAETAHSETSAPEAPVTELSVDEHGKIIYYGPTSAVHDPPQRNSPTLAVPSPETVQHSSRTAMRHVLALHAQEMTLWEDFALGNAALQTGIPRPVMAKLLHTHWTWVCPMFMWVYRPAFIRDMATGGRYYSEFLLTVICAHSAKYQEGNAAEFLLARARRLLGTAIQQPSSIPTVQALLQLSARDLAHGSISQAWVYSGIAFRMASDLGLQHSTKDVRGLNHVDLEIRRRLFWGCYFWDKATSLYAGRLPAVQEVLDYSSLDLLDDSTDGEIWTPYYGDSLNLTRLSNNEYPPMKSEAVSCFANSCKLSIIINDIIIQLYDRRNRTINEAALRDIKHRLDLWRSQSPARLRYDPDNLPSICPPPHIISQNLLYYASVILTHRPFWSVPHSYEVCINASRNMEKLILLLEATFGLANITYLMGYCVYTGASAILEEVRKGDSHAHATMQTFLRAINKGMKSCPLLERSLKIIIKGMSSPSAHHYSMADTPGQKECMPPTTNGFIPAFPFVGPSIDMNFDMHAYFGGTDMDSMATLDSYPEAQLDFATFVPPLS